jgi:hypothetical protein
MCSIVADLHSRLLQSGIRLNRNPPGIRPESNASITAGKQITQTASFRGILEEAGQNARTSLSEVERQKGE